MRHVLLALAALAVACDSQTPSTSAPPPPVIAEPRADLICDSINAPIILIGTHAANGGFTLVSYDKTRDGAESARDNFTLGVAEGAAGSVYTPLLRDGAEAGHLRVLNPGVLDEPGAAYTDPLTSIRLDDRDIACRWLSRTRLVAFSDRRSLVINEDADGDLIYTTFDFSNAGPQTVELSGGQRSTTFSLEVRGGEEMVTPAGAEFRFANRGHEYVVRVPAVGAAEVDVRRTGEIVQTEPLIGVQLATGPR